MNSSDLVVDEFLLTILEKTRRTPAEVVEKKDLQAAQFLIRSEESVLGLLESSERNEIEFPPLNSFYRRIIHALARKYDLVHRVEATNIFNSATTRRKIYLMKPVDLDLSRVPILKCSDWVENGEESVKGISELFVLKSQNEANVPKNLQISSVSETNQTSNVPKIKILKRTNNANNSSNTPDTNVNVQKESIQDSTSNSSLEEREARYQAARERIFEGFNAENGNEYEIDNSKIVMMDNENLLNGAVNSLTIDNGASSSLNPNAAPYNESSRIITFNHIFKLTGKNGDLLTHSDLTNLLEALETQQEEDQKEHLKTSFSIKVHQIPAKYAFLIIHGNNSRSSSLVDENKFDLKALEATLLE